MCHWCQCVHGSAQGRFTATALTVLFAQLFYQVWCALGLRVLPHQPVLSWPAAIFVSRLPRALTKASVMSVVYGQQGQGTDGPPCKSVYILSHMFDHPLRFTSPVYSQYMCPVPVPPLCSSSPFQRRLGGCKRPAAVAYGASKTSQLDQS